MMRANVQRYFFFLRFANKKVPFFLVSDKWDFFVYEVENRFRLIYFFSVTGMVVSLWFSFTVVLVCGLPSTRA